MPGSLKIQDKTTKGILTDSKYRYLATDLNKVSQATIFRPNLVLFELSLSSNYCLLQFSSVFDSQAWFPIASMAGIVPFCSPSTPSR